ncbi:hypothetical protein Asulf_00681 [Archaeoglobus sulfaticallidus PM70-1]|uniref:Nmd3 N-terminal domain-containing protein n=1 Tax=Archaeoglobus sulfaticallidus PM70-1 TaxID=387631 RepID=N0BAR3_9EURY|nr:NMD3-related protein [Archaeoglobus sulfaticallidus]AGK60699.1 hypothetical protein Asulf_00681 [Archaeoglobus sulfaticallidus PM70-1]
MEVKHPAILQLRNLPLTNLQRVLERKGFEFEIEKAKKGYDVYFSDVNDARKFISDLKRNYRFKIKMSTKYAGLRKGRVRVLFVYSLRGEEIGEE